MLYIVAVNRDNILIWSLIRCALLGVPDLLHPAPVPRSFLNSCVTSISSIGQRNDAFNSIKVREEINSFWMVKCSWLYVGMVISASIVQRSSVLSCGMWGKACCCYRQLNNTQRDATSHQWTMAFHTERIQRAISQSLILKVNVLRYFRFSNESTIWFFLAEYELIIWLFGDLKSCKMLQTPI